MAKAAKKATTPATDPNDELGGLTSTECSYNCTGDCCVISGRNICGHPNKGGGTQPAIQSDPAAVTRYNRARKMLAIEAANRRN